VVVQRADELVAQMKVMGGESFELTSALAVGHAMRGEIDVADAFFEQALTRARELGARLHLAAGHPQLETHLLLGRYSETERTAREGIERLRAMGERGYLATSLVYLAEAIVSQDRPDEAETTLREAEEHAADDDAVTVIGIRRIRAEILRRQGRLDEAEQHARDAVAFADTTDYLHEVGDAHRVLAEILLTKGEREEGLAHLYATLDLFERKGILVLLDELRERIAEVEAW
jgi:tetratricopeptide (TPR) repeat protein